MRVSISGNADGAGSILSVFSAVWQHTIEVAVGEVGQLERRWFTDPALARRLEEIAKKHDWEVARLQTEGYVADRREENIEAPDGWGGTRRVVRTKLYLGHAP